jgi:hypothetical protein
MQNAMDQLKAYALANYEAGGHWVAETHDDARYAEVLAKAGNDVDAAKAKLRAYWQLLESVSSDIANS